MSQDDEIIVPPPPEFLKKFYNVVASCNRCGFCTSYCPTYNATGDEGLSPRGRNQTFRALIEGKLTDPVSAQNIIDTCLLCGECTSVCFSEVPTAQLMITARSLINQTQGIPKPLDFFFRHILSRRAVFHWTLKIVFLGKQLGLSKILLKMKFFSKYSHILRAADALVEDVPLKFLTDYKAVKVHMASSYEKIDHAALVAESKIERLKKSDGTVPEELMKQAGFVRRPKVAYFPVCGSQYLNPNIGLSTLKLLKKLKIDFVIPELLCCGLPAASYGELNRVREMAKENIKRLEKGNYEALLVDDSSCGSHLKDYPKFFQDERDWQARAQALSQKIREITSFFLQRGLTDQLRRATWVGGPVAYHDPCKAQYSQKVTQPPRELLQSIKKLILLPINDSDQCCGGGGSYSFVHADLSQDILSRKIKNVTATGCKILITSSASCMVQISSGLRKISPKIEVLHINEFLVRALDKQR